MEVEVDHYAVLGLPSGEEGSKLTEKDISKAYKIKALELHPDKRRNDPNAHDNFQRLKSSYEILKDEKARKLFDDLLRVKRDHQRRNSERDSRKRKMVSDLEERERASLFPEASSYSSKERAEEERIAQQLKEEIARIRAMMGNNSSKESSSPFSSAPSKTQMDGGSGGATEVDKQKILKVSWERIGRDYSSERLKEIFSEFGQVEDVIIKSSKNKKKGSALVVMASKEAVAAATGNVCGDISNPLLVLPLQPAVVPSFRKSPESEKLDHMPGVGYQEFENNVLKKLREAAEGQKK